MSDDVIRIKTRVKYQGAWMPWRELANDYSIVNALREKAPDGYGLGSNAKLLTADDDLNTVLTTGWYNWSWAAHPQNAPDNNWREYGCAMHVFSTTPGGYAIQIVYDLSDDITHGCAIQRTIYVLSSGKVYYPWEWVNPPMQLGVEYRTTERYKGKPVYAKLVDCGKFPAPGSSKQIAHGISNCYPIRVTGQMINSNTVPWSEAYSIGADGTNIRLYAQTGFSDQSGTNTVALIHYTKTTD